MPKEEDVSLKACRLRPVQASFSTSWAQAPFRLQLIRQRRLCEDGVAGKTADTSSSAADGGKLSSRDAAAVAPDTTGIAHRVGILELLGRSKVQVGEGRRLSKQVPDLC